jgi:hypothetical protein
VKDCVKVNTLVEYGMKSSNNDEWEKISSTTFKSLIVGLRYLTCTHLDILFRVRLVTRLMETPTIMHLKALKWIIWYIKSTIDFGLFYSYSNSFDLMGYSDND